MSAGRSDFSPLVEYSLEGRIASITLNRPAKLNALNDELSRQLDDAFRRFDQDEDAWVAILSGAGRAFSSGADVRERHDRPPEELESALGRAFEHHPYDSLLDCQNWKPVIGAAHGYVLGAALGLLLACDLTVVANDAQLQVTETRRGLWSGLYWNQIRIRAGVAFADDMCLTGRFVSGDEAAKAGLVTAAVHTDDRLVKAKALAEGILQNPPGSIRATVLARRWQLRKEERDWPLLKAATPLHRTEDFQTRAKAFTEESWDVASRLAAE